MNVIRAAKLGKNPKISFKMEIEGYDKLAEDIEHMLIGRGYSTSVSEILAHSQGGSTKIFLPSKKVALHEKMHEEFYMRNKEVERFQIPHLMNPMHMLHPTFHILTLLL